MANDLDNDFLSYLADHADAPGSQLPPLTELSQELGISISKLREQMEVARALGFVDIRPRTGIQTRPYSIFPGLRISLRYGLASGMASFQEIKDLREHLETCFWKQAVLSLRQEEKTKLQSLVHKAWSMLRGNPIQIPHDEHRELHLTIFSRLNNGFVQGILESYWDAYEMVGLSLYTDYTYLEEVWSHHEQMVEAICAGNYDQGYKALIEHFAILASRPVGSDGIQDEVMKNRTFIKATE